MASLYLRLFLLIASITQILAADQTAKTYIIRVDTSSKPSVFPTHYHWYSAEFTEPTTILHIYDTVFHGFSAVLSPSQAASVLRHPSILTAFEDRRRQLHTTRSPQFLGLRNQRGLWSESDYGSDVIIGLFDTGIWPERRSFSDLNLGPVPRRWRGTCETGAASGFGGIVGGINETIEFKSPRDADGHGTHTASTAAGRHAFRASMEGYAFGVAKGVAPKARLAIYKVCWSKAGCFDSDILAAFDAAVNDGVDVISISIGGGEGISSPYYLDPIAIGSYGAVSRGIFVSSSAGNEGPNGMSVTNLAPWLTTVGAGTIDRDFPADVVLNDRRKFSGVSLYAGEPLNGKMYPLVYPGKSGSLDPNQVRGRIVICDRGSNPRVAKGLVVKKAGGIGMILANGASNGEGLVGDAHLIPTCAVGSDAGDNIKKYLASNPNASATIIFRGTLVGVKPAPVVASFSARGPNGLNPEILKPDLIAPGVNILAAWTEAVGPTGLDSDTRKSEFNILSGTSMACPHVSGAAALLKSAHPDWSPAAIRSAMMTTASLTDNSFDPMVDESTKKPATPYDFGAGHLNLERAMDPGLVYDLTDNDYVSFLCGIEYGPKTIQVITRSRVNCPMRKPMPENLNYPSIAALFPSGSKGVSSKTFFRMVTNVGEANVVYRLKVEPPKGVKVSVKPWKLVFSENVRRLGYYVTVTVDSKHLVLDDSGAVFGSLSWDDGEHVVRSPIVVTQLAPL
ncbi:subtilisin-like protease [Phtheirospermum japonicum]|uniref:Subtilisin-like protease n=1 Tax=Phtheirospermum japonicum TaxID=374723 RepID=A0A830BNA4_9LAMI|nr:subtilisin-like protease [Phtheirospermum japonicum]